MKKSTVLAINGMLGKGFPMSSFEAGMARKPDIIGADAGSVDGGPSYLATGLTGIGVNGIYRDLKAVLPRALETKTPFVIGSAGTAGGKPQVDLFLGYLKQIKEECNLRDFTVAVILSEIPKDYIKLKITEGKIKAMPGLVPTLTAEIVDGAERIVGQMGIDPFVEALKLNTDVVLTGRACDTAIYAAHGVMIGLPIALAKHAAKIIECGTLCAVPPSGGDCMLAEIFEDHFTIETLNPKRGVTEMSVAAHTMYENDHPSQFYEPEGLVDCSECKFEQISPSCIKISGTKHVDLPHSIKLEGSTLEGYRSIAFSSSRDATFIKNFDYIKEASIKAVDEMIGTQEEAGYTVNFRVFGHNAILGALEREPFEGHEMCILLDVVAKTQQDADDIVSQYRNQLMHKDFPGRKSVGGNSASPISPLEIPVGPVFEFSIFHIMQTDGDKLFNVEVREV